MHWLKPFQDAEVDWHAWQVQLNKSTGPTKNQLGSIGRLQVLFLELLTLTPYPVLPTFLAGGPWAFSSSLLSSLLSLDEVFFLAFLVTGPFACNFRFGALVDLLR